MKSHNFQGRVCPVSHHRSHHLRQRDPLGDRARLPRPMGLYVDHDEKREEGQVNRLGWEFVKERF